MPNTLKELQLQMRRCFLVNVARKQLAYKIVMLLKFSHQIVLITSIFQTYMAEGTRRKTEMNGN